MLSTYTHTAAEEAVDSLKRLVGRLSESPVTAPVLSVMSSVGSVVGAAVTRLFGPAETIPSWLRTDASADAGTDDGVDGGADEVAALGTMTLGALTLLLVCCCWAHCCCCGGGCEAKDVDGTPGAMEEGRGYQRLGGQSSSSSAVGGGEEGGGEACLKIQRLMRKCLPLAQKSMMASMLMRAQWSAWKEDWVGQRKIRRALARVANRPQSQCINSWRAVVAEMNESRAKMRKALQSILNSKTRKVLA